MLLRFKTIADVVRFEAEPTKGSRFFARLSPAPDEIAAKAFIETVAVEFRDARHVCYAWRLGASGSETRAFDAGEPGNSAGRPILMQLEGRGVTDVVAVVVRYFGGVKLGVGGLMRAYGGAAGQALDRANIVEVQVLDALTLRHAYSASSAVAAALAAVHSIPDEAHYGELVELEVRVPRAERARFEELFRDATGGRGALEARGTSPGGASSPRR